MRPEEQDRLAREASKRQEREEVARLNAAPHCVACGHPTRGQRWCSNSCRITEDGPSPEDFDALDLCPEPYEADEVCEDAYVWDGFEALVR